MKKKAKEKILEIQGHTYWSDGTAHGQCGQCRIRTSYHFDENGVALCGDCLTENHLNGKYSDDCEEFWAECPNCSAQWGIEEMDEQYCFACGYPNNEDDEDDDYEDYEDFGEDEDDNVFRALHDEF